MKKTQETWKNAVAEITGRNPDAPGFHAEKDRERIRTVKTLLRRTETGTVLLDWAEANGVEIWMDYQLPPSIRGRTVIGSNTVMLNGKRPDKNLVASLAHELFHVWQDHQGLLPHSVDKLVHFPPTYFLFEASAFAVEAKVLAELKAILEPHDFKHYRTFVPTKALFQKGKTPDDVALDSFKSFMTSPVARTYRKNCKRALENLLAGRQSSISKTSSDYTSSDMNYRCDPAREPVELKPELGAVTPFGSLPDGTSFLEGKLTDDDIKPFFQTNEIMSPLQWAAVKTRRAYGRHVRGIKKIVM